ncbi:MAG: hypothetical protein Q3974_04405 [Rothia sp. (in: high G+C Gram-positive bacteria)]|nr:hypothetical protein [Rothia sp. (in: high G+C Gram-positive bacteria)]
MAGSSLSSGYSSLLHRAIAQYEPSPADSPVDSPKFLRSLGTMFESCYRSFSAENRAFEPASLNILSAGMRSVVLRVSFLPSFGEPHSLILKHFRRKDSATNSGGFGYLREKHGLRTLSQLPHQPYAELVFADDAARVLGIEDVPGTPCARNLLDASASFTNAEAALVHWKNFWTQVVNAQACEPFARLRSDFSLALVKADPDARQPGMLASSSMAVKGLEKLRTEESVDHEITFETVLSPANPHQLVLSSADFSPFNVLHTHDAARGIDAEGTSIHHLLLPVAEMLLGFPSAGVHHNFRRHFSSEQWKNHCESFYRDIAVTPRSTMEDDPDLRVAVLLTRSVLREQGVFTRSPWS